MRLCSIPDQEYSIPFHNVKQKNHSLPQFDTLLNLLLVRFRPSDKRRRSWWTRYLIQTIPWTAGGVESQTTAAAEPVTSSVSSKSTEQQKALRQRDGHLPPARRRHLGSASWGWPAATSRSPLQSSSPSQQNSHLVISVHNESSRMTWSEWSDPQSRSSGQIRFRSPLQLKSLVFHNVIVIHNLSPTLNTA